MSEVLNVAPTVKGKVLARYCDSSGSSQLLMTVEYSGGLPNFRMYSITEGGYEELGCDSNPIALEREFCVKDVS